MTAATLIALAIVGIIVYSVLVQAKANGNDGNGGGQVPFCSMAICFGTNASAYYISLTILHKIGMPWQVGDVSITGHRNCITAEGKYGIILVANVASTSSLGAIQDKIEASLKLAGVVITVHPGQAECNIF